MVDMKILLEKEDRVWSNQRENIKCDKVIKVMNQTPGSGVCMCMYVQVHVYALVYICVCIV